MTVDDLKAFRDRLYLDIPDDALESGRRRPTTTRATDSPEYEYLMERRRALDGFLPDRVERSKTVVFPRDEIIDQLTAGTGEKVQASTTMAFTRLLRTLLKDAEIGPRVVPIIPDEARTFGMDALFAEFKIYSPLGQLYEPVDAALMLSYREAVNGQLLEEGITEAGAMALVPVDPCRLCHANKGSGGFPKPLGDDRERNTFVEEPLDLFSLPFQVLLPGNTKDGMEAVVAYGLPLCGQLLPESMEFLSGFPPSSLYRFRIVSLSHRKASCRVGSDSRLLAQRIGSPSRSYGKNNPPRSPRGGRT